MLFDRTTIILRATLKGLVLRQQAIASNIANVDTPGFQRRRVEFEEQLREQVRALELEEAKDWVRLKNFRPRITVDSNGIERNDKTSVDIEAELVALADTNLKHDAIIEQLRQRIGLLRYVITEGRR